MTDDRVLSDFRWPIIALDFEASAVGRKSYPIEVGISIWWGDERPVQTWSSLIGMTAKWLQLGDWDPKSAAVHGISPTRLQNAPSPAEIMTTLNKLIGIGGVVYCDGGSHDQHWFDRLAEQAEVMPAFELGSLQRLVESLSPVQKAVFIRNQPDEEHTAHRAGPDAQDHIRCLAAALGRADLVFEDIEIGD